MRVQKNGSHPNRVMLAQETIVNVFLKCSKAATGHVRLPDCLYLLEAMLLAQGVERVIDTV